LQVKLDGYADPRGDADYNLSLSQQRVDSVAQALVAAGIEPSRIETFYHGAHASTASSGDYDAYALERKVRIQLLGAENAARISYVE
jgi:outer membrane protein OmpA-like peptidoglycan-associated protein